MPRKETKVYLDSTGTLRGFQQRVIWSQDVSRRVYQMVQGELEETKMDTFP